MRHLPLVLLVCFLWTSTDLPAQIRIGKKLTDKINERFGRKVDKGLDKGLDKVEQGVEEGVKGEGEQPGSENQGTVSEDTPNNQASNGQEEPPLRAYSGFSFEEGIHTIFEFKGESDYGEFPSKFGLLRGSAENAQFGEDSVISFMTRSTIIYPLMETEEYLPESWTLVFDAYFYYKGNEAYMINFPGGGEIHFRDDRASYKNFSGMAKEGRGASHKAGWRHYSISFNKRALKVYIDQNRILNVPDVDAKLTKFTIEALSPSSTTQGTSVIKNIRIAEGGEKLYNNLVTDSKIVTNDILFEVDKAVLLAKSVGIINSIVGMMKKRSEINFNIVGHTDGDGEENYNQKLSEDRAAAVRDEMIKRGIDGSRLRSEGKGELDPIASNATDDGKAQNRRVEFVPF